jgi:hypothetical protein
MILWVALLIYGATSGFAQEARSRQADAEQAYFDQADVWTDKANDAFFAKEYGDAEQYYQKMIAGFGKLSAQTRKARTEFKSEVYYALARVQAMQKKKNPALRSFEQAVADGYTAYRSILNDPYLAYIRGEKRFQTVMERLKDKSFHAILQKANGYAPSQRRDTLPRFTYMAPNDRHLVRVREYFRLDSVAGAGDELSKIKNILTFVHNTIEHDGSSDSPKVYDAISLAEACKDGSRGLNCRGLATVLNECYLAMGFKSRFVTCMPAVYVDDCHVINAVYSVTLDKWVWVDPTNNAWVTDEKGNMLSIQEVRERLRQDLPLVLNDEANWNNREKVTANEYLYDYMAKNLYYVNCMLRSEYNAESTYNRANYVCLIPVGYTCDDLKGKTTTSDDQWFWQSPYTER